MITPINLRAESPFENYKKWKENLSFSYCSPNIDYFISEKNILEKILYRLERLGQKNTKVKSKNLLLVFCTFFHIFAKNKTKKSQSKSYQN